jgi:hypothetical protein
MVVANLQNLLRDFPERLPLNLQDKRSPIPQIAALQNIVKRRERKFFMIQVTVFHCFSFRICGVGELSPFFCASCHILRLWAAPFAIGLASSASIAA